jgi:predicted porin
MNQVKKISMAVAGACALLGASAANAGIGFKAGAWDVDFSGNINAFYTATECDSNVVAIVGGLACGGGDEPVSIRSGLLPSALVVSAKTNQANFDIGVTVGFYPNINSVSGTPNQNAAGTPVALGNSGIDMRQNFLTFGQSWGTLKFGRDIGLFGSDAILSDMTLLGVGSPGGNAFPGGTSLGRIGLGYIYTDWIPQITYSTPKGLWGGLGASVGVFTPFQPSGVVAPAVEQEDPGFQGKLTWDFSGPVTGRLWAGFMFQDQEFQVPVGGNSGFDGEAYDVGAKIGFGPAEIMAYYYTGEGVGTTGLFLNAVSAAGEERDSDGGIIQGTVKFGATKLGLSYGVSKLDEASGEVNPTLVDENASWVFGIYHALTPALNLVFEYINTETEAQGPGVSDIEEDSFAIGAILFF